MLCRSVQVGALVVVDEHEVELPGAEAVLVGQRVERRAAVADGADHTGDPVVDAGVRPRSAAPRGVGRRELDGEHLGRRRRAGDPQRAVAAVGAQLQREARVGAADGGVEQRALLVADVDQERLLVGELVDRCQHVVDVAPAGVGHHVVGGGRLASVADLAGLGDVAGTRPPAAETTSAGTAIRCFRLMVASLSGRLADRARTLPAGLARPGLRPVKLARMFAMGVGCLTSDGPA